MTELLWANLRAPELRALAAQDAIVLVPVGSMEQHGPHLPVQVDSLISTEVCVRAARQAQAQAPVVVAPTVWCGLAEHHMDFGGTITLDLATFSGLLRCVCQSLVRHGFRRILLHNGHGGNIEALNVIVGELARELDAPVATATYPMLRGVAQQYGEILEQQDNVRHAGEAESSMLLALAPDLVDEAAMRDPQTANAAAGRRGGAYRYRPFAERTQSGVMGFPAAASAEKGERLLDVAAAALAEAVLGDELW